MVGVVVMTVDRAEGEKNASERGAAPAKKYKGI